MLDRKERMPVQSVASPESLHPADEGLLSQGIVARVLIEKLVADKDGVVVVK